MLYSVTIDEENKTANAVDDVGAVIVSLSYENEAELLSADFVCMIRDAVALQQQESVSDGWEDDMMMSKIWDEEDGLRQVLEMLDLEEQQRAETEERDRQLALELQMKEEQGAKTGVWGSSQAPWRVDIASNAASSYDDSEYPSLPDQQRRPQSSVRMKPKRKISERDPSATWIPHIEDEFEHEMIGWKPVTDSIQAVTLSQGIDSRDRSFILSAATAIEEKSGPGIGISTDGLRKMMSVSDDAEDNSKEESEVDREKYSRKSIRKLVLDMIGAGWKPLRRGGGHYIYEREVQIPGQTPYKQILVLPSTPSSQKSIDRVYAKLIRCDKEVAEKKNDLQRKQEI